MSTPALLDLLRTLVQLDGSDLHITTATPPQIERLLRETDAVAEVHNTLRVGTPVDLILTPSP